MKHFLIIISILFCTNSYAQVHFGLSSGAAVTKFRLKDNFGFDHSALTGFNIGVPTLFKFNKNIALESAIYYLNMGSTMTFNVNVIDANDPIYQSIKDTKYYYRINYLSIPLTFNYSIPISTYSIYAKAGGYFSYALNSNVKNNNSNEKDNLDFKDENIKRTDLGILFGIGVTRELGNGFVFFDARYMIGCSYLARNKDYYTTTHNAYNRGVFLNVGYMFNLGKS